MSQRLHSRRPAPHLARPIDRRGSNPARALAGALALAASTALLIIAWYALAVWIGGAV